MNSEKKLSAMGMTWLAVVLVAGVAARYGFGSLGHNYDYDSYRIVVNLCEQGSNVYAGTDRYNYGPVWFNVLHLLDLLAGHHEAVFRWLLIGVLSMADAGIALILWRQFGPLAAVVFFLNPISMMISGFQNQFDNVAVLLGLGSVLVYGDEVEKPLDRRRFLGLALLGLSLMTKHVFFAFPLWLAVKQRGLLQKCLILAIPTAIFLAGFLPYWPAGHAGIIQHVFLYRSDTSSSAFFYGKLVPGLLQDHLSPTTCWLAILVAFAFVCRPKSSLESLLVYTCVLVAATPAMGVQYLVIPAAAAAAFVNPFFVAYLLFAGLHFSVIATGLALMKDSGGCMDAAVLCLCAAVAWWFGRPAIGRFLEKCFLEISRQFKRGG